MIPNGSIDYDNEDDDDEEDDDVNDDINGRYDSISAVAAGSRSKSLPRNVATRPTTMSAPLTSTANRYHWPEWIEWINVLCMVFDELEISFEGHN